MYNILIVDDDNHVREMLKKIIDWEEYGFQIVDEAIDGIEAIEKINIKKIDLLIIDMSMPQLDGLEVIKYIKSEGINLKILVLSCHDDFEFVKEAMKYGANEYVLKHLLTKEKLIHEIFILKKSIQEDEKKKLELFKETSLNNEGIESLKNKLLINILKNKDISKYMDGRVRYYYDELRSKTFGMILIQIINHKKAEQQFDPNGHDIFNLVLNNIIKEISDTQYDYEMLDMDNGYYIILISMVQISLAEIKEDLETTLYSIKNVLMSYFQISSQYVIAINKIPYKGLAGYYDSLMNKSNHFYYEKKLIINNQAYERISEADIKLDERYIKSLTECINNNDFEKLREKMVDNLENILIDRVHPQKVKLYIMDIIKNVISYITYRFDIHMDLDVIENINQNINGTIKSVELTLCLNRFVDYVVQLVFNDSYEGIDNEYIKESIRYIQSHYQENISLAEVASYLHVNPTYFSHMFKSCVGINYVDYVKELRIKKACDYLENYDIKIKDIGEAIGIPNRKYFSKIFKNMVGTSPLQYKKEHL